MAVIYASDNEGAVKTMLIINSFYTDYLIWYSYCTEYILYEFEEWYLFRGNDQGEKIRYEHFLGDSIQSRVVSRGRKITKTKLCLLKTLDVMAQK